MVETIKHIFDVTGFLFTLALLCRLVGAMRDVYLARALVRSGAAPEQIGHAIEVFSSYDPSATSPKLLPEACDFLIGEPVVSSTFDMLSATLSAAKKQDRIVRPRKAHPR